MVRHLAATLLLGALALSATHASATGAGEPLKPIEGKGLFEALFGDEDDKAKKAAPAKTAKKPKAKKASSAATSSSYSQ